VPAFTTTSSLTTSSVATEEYGSDVDFHTSTTSFKASSSSGSSSSSRKRKTASQSSTPCESEDDCDSFSPSKRSKKSSASSASLPSSTRKSAFNKSAYPVLSPFKYANYLISLFNQRDLEALAQCFQDYFTPDARILMNIYNLKEEYSQESNEIPFNVNPFGNFTTANMSLSEFLRYQESLDTVVPDGFYELQTSKCCYFNDKHGNNNINNSGSDSEENDTSAAYIASYHSYGTIINRENACIGHGNAYGQLINIRSVSDDDLSFGGSPMKMQSYFSQGSFIIYRNFAGKITSLEYYTEYHL
jgi:hypothetical protein